MQMAQEFDPGKRGILETIFKMLRYSSEQRIRDYSNYLDFKVSNYPQNTPFILYHWMAAIVLCGAPVKIVLRVHFSSVLAKLLISNIFGKSVNISELDALDFFKEYSNLTAGHIKAVFMNQKYDVGIGLPVLMRGANDIFFPRGKGHYTDRWKLESAVGSFAFSAIIEIASWRELENIHFTRDDMQNPDTDINFFL